MLGPAEVSPNPELILRLWQWQDPPIIPPHISPQNKDTVGRHKTYSQIFCSPRDCKHPIRRKKTERMRGRRRTRQKNWSLMVLAT
jgi:hypothetical protein